MGIPKGLKDIVLEESDFQCAYCGYREGLHLTVHHIVPSKADGDTCYENLIALCFNCHEKVNKSKKISIKEIRRLKRHLVKKYLTQQGVNALKYAFWYDQVDVSPVLVHNLVERGLLKFEKKHMWAAHDIINTYSITENGRKLAEQWVLNKSELKKKPKSDISD